MKNQALFAITAICTSLSAMASGVNGLTTFSAGTSAKAAEVNANFTAVKTAVDDNNARLTNAESQKQNRVTGTCSVGSAVTAVAADGTVSCGVNSDSRFGSNTNLATGGVPSPDCLLGQILLFAGNQGFAMPASGQLLAIRGNEPLFSLLGTRFGGDGRNTFALPDLRGAAPNGLTYTICMSGIFPVTN